MYIYTYKHIYIHTNICTYMFTYLRMQILSAYIYSYILLERTYNHVHTIKCDLKIDGVGRWPA